MMSISPDTNQSEADRGEEESCLPGIGELSGGVVEGREEGAGGAGGDGLETGQHCEHLPQHFITSNYLVVKIIQNCTLLTVVKLSQFNPMIIYQ